MIDALVDTIDTDRLVRGCAALVDVAAPTGYERACAEHIVSMLTERGVEAELMALDDRSANAWARIPASGPNAGNGPTLLLYSPIDTVTTGDTADDVPQVADEITGHLLAHGDISDDGALVTGLGAHNPKGHAACIIEAATVLAQSDVDVAGDVIIAFGAGGMPTFPLDHDDRTATGHGAGALHLLAEFERLGVQIDAAVIAKSGWFVQHEEVGLAWVDVTVGGTHTYVGARHRLPYRNPIVDAARLAIALEDKFTRPVTNSAGTLEPQAMVASLHAGWQRMAAFLPATAVLRVDQRLLPGETGESALHRVVDTLGDLCADDHELSAQARLTVDIAGSHTDPDHWICDAGRAAWEAIEQRPHDTPTRLSGSTDANILRNGGIPTMRIGLPKVHVEGREVGFAEGMNTVDAASMRTLTELLLRTVHNVHTATTATATTAAPHGGSSR